MKVFKIHCSRFYYVFAAPTKEEAIASFVEETGEQFTACEEVPESDWDKEVINVFEGNDFSKKPYQISIRQAMQEKCNLLFTNDFSNFD